MSCLCKRFQIQIKIIIIFVCVFVQDDKVYVQHRVKEQAKLLWDLIVNKNAFFYMAGYIVAGFNMRGLCGCYTTYNINTASNLQI